MNKIKDMLVEIPYRWFIFSRKTVGKIEGLNFSIPRTPNGIMTGNYRGLELVENDIWYEYKNGKVFKDENMKIRAMEENRDLSYEELGDLWISTKGYTDRLKINEELQYMYESKDFVELFYDKLNSESKRLVYKIAKDYIDNIPKVEVLKWKNLGMINEVYEKNVKIIKKYESEMI